MNVNVHVTKAINVQRSFYNFAGVVDNRRRLIGSVVNTWEADHVEIAESNPSWHRRGTPGHKFYVYVQSTRNGTPYGAAGRDQAFDSADERAAYITKYLRDAERRFTKRFGKA